MSLAAEESDQHDDFKTIGEVAFALKVPQHVLRFWEGQFPQIKPLKRKGGRRFYSPKDVEILERIRSLLYTHAYTIKGAKKALREGFTQGDDSDMRKKAEKHNNENQIDIFEMIERSTQPNTKEQPVKISATKTEVKAAAKAEPAKSNDSESLKKILHSLKEIQLILAAG